MVVADGQLATEDMVTLDTLAGGLARDSPQIYRVSTALNESTGYGIWIREYQRLGVSINDTFLNDFAGIVTHFASSIAGYVSFTLASNESANAAITYVAGMPTFADGSVLVAAGSNSTIALLESLGIPLVADLTSENVSNVYLMFRENYCGNMASFQPVVKAAFLGDYSVFGNLPQLEFLGDTGGPTCALVLDDIAHASNIGAGFGWGPSELTFVGTLSLNGAYVHASDYSKDLAVLTNLNVHSSTSHKDLAAQYPSLIGHRETRLSNTHTHTSSHSSRSLSSSSTVSKAGMNNEDVNVLSANHTVTFLMTDGDNLQFLLGDWASDPTWYGSPQRGEAAMGWTIPPGLVELAPIALEYIYRVATQSDGFVSAPSGLGYTYPEVLSRLDLFGNLTNEACGLADINIVNIIGQNSSEEFLGPILLQDNIDALFYYSYGNNYCDGGQIYWYSGKPVVTSRAALWGTGTSLPALDVGPLVEYLTTLPKDPSSSMGYSLIPVHAWSHSFADVVNASNMLLAKGGFNIVPPKEFVSLLTANLSPCPNPEGSYSDSCSNCSVSSTCVLTCDCEDKGGSEASQCNLNCCSDLSNLDGVLACNDAPCPMSC